MSTMGWHAAVRCDGNLGDVDSAFNRGVLLVRRGLLADAELAFSRADERGDAGAASNLGVLLERRGDLVGADAAYRRADERGDAGGAFNLGVLLEQRGAVVEAIEAFRRADERGDAGAASSLGVLLERRGDLVGAEVAYRRADERGDAGGAFNLGVLLERRGVVSGASAAFRRAAEREDAAAASDANAPPEVGGDAAEAMRADGPGRNAAEERRSPRARNKPAALGRTTGRVLALGVVALMMYAVAIAFGMRVDRAPHVAKATPPRSTARIAATVVAAQPQQLSATIVHPGHPPVRTSTHKTATRPTASPPTHPAIAQAVAQPVSNSNGATDNGAAAAADPATNESSFAQGGDTQDGGDIQGSDESSAGTAGPVSTENRSSVPPSDPIPARGSGGSTGAGSGVSTSSGNTSGNASGTSPNGSGETGTGTTSGGG
jgi:Flp pilus assembly protein TadD